LDFVGNLAFNRERVEARQLGLSATLVTVADATASKSRLEQAGEFKEW
jgi:hypothetical protein